MVFSMGARTQSMVDLCLLQQHWQSLIENGSYTLKLTQSGLPRVTSVYHIYIMNINEGSLKKNGFLKHAAPAKPNLETSADCGDWFLGSIIRQGCWWLHNQLYCMKNHLKNIKVYCDVAWFSHPLGVKTSGILKGKSWRGTEKKSLNIQMDQGRL